MTIQTYHIPDQAMHTDRTPSAAFDATEWKPSDTALDRPDGAISPVGFASGLPVTPKIRIGWLEGFSATAQGTIRELRTSTPGNTVTVAGKTMSALGASFRQKESEESNGTA